MLFLIGILLVIVGVIVCAAFHERSGAMLMVGVILFVSGVVVLIVDDCSGENEFVALAAVPKAVALTVDHHVESKPKTKKKSKWWKSDIIDFC